MKCCATLLATTKIQLVPSGRRDPTKMQVEDELDEDPVVEENDAGESELVPEAAA